MEGDISVQSIEGEGSRFDFHIVVHKQTIDSIRKSASTEKSDELDFEEIILLMKILNDTFLNVRVIKFCLQRIT